MRVTTDDGVGLATDRRRPRRAPRPAPRPRHRRRQGRLRRPRRRASPGTTGSSRSTTGATARATPPTIRPPTRSTGSRADALAVADAHRAARPAAARALDGRDGDAPSRARRTPALRRGAGVHGHVGRPAARARSRPRRPRGRGRARRRVWRCSSSCPTSSTCSDRPAYQRVLAERPGFREYADYKWSAQSPVMWATMVHEIIDAARPARRRWRRSSVPMLGIVGDAGHRRSSSRSRDIVGDGTRRRARRHARRRALAAVREPAGVAATRSLGSSPRVLRRAADGVEAQSPAAFSMKRVRSTITRVMRPAATSPWPSLTETRKLSRRPSMRLERRLGAHVATHRGGREVVELHAVPDARRALGELAVDRRARSPPRRA